MATTAEGRLVERARTGDQQAFGQLFDALFDRVHDLSRRIVHDDGIAGEVAQDAFLTAWRKLGTLEDVDAFGGWLLRIARNASLNRLAKERRAVATDDETMSAITDAQAPDHDPLDRMDQAARTSLVWDAAAALGERDASVLDLHLRHGLAPAELAEELGVTANNASQILFQMKARLGKAVRALVLWRAGHPTCPELALGLSAAGLTSFGAPMVKAIDRHVDACAGCAEDRTERLSPAALFAAAPIVAAGTLVRSTTAHALAAEGVPMAGSSALAGGAPGAGSGAGRAPGADTSGPASSAAGPPVPPTTAEIPMVTIDGPPPPDGRRTRGAARGPWPVLAGLLLVLLVGGAILLLRGVDEDGVDSAATLPVVDTTLPGTTTPSPTTTVPGSVPPLTTPPTTPVDTSPPPTAPPTAPTTTPPTTAPPTTAPLPPPTIDRFTAGLNGKPCDGGVAWDLSWATTGADTASVGPTGQAGQPATVPEGAATLCAPSGTTFTLVATGPGGEATATDGGDVVVPPTIVG